MLLSRGGVGSKWLKQVREENNELSFKEFVLKNISKHIVHRIV